jgi:hypothetical protein
MRMWLFRVATIAGVSALALAPVGLVPPAAAATGVNWSAANFHGYATGTEVHFGALPVSGTNTAEIDQAISAASTSTAGLSSTLSSEFGLQVQPAEPASVHAYGTGTGIRLALGSAAASIAGQAQQVAPPDNPPVTDSVSTPSQLAPLISASLLTGQGAAVWDANSCPIGQDISYGLGDAAAVGILNAGSGPTISTAGTGTSAAQTTSSTYLTPNGDGTWGLSTTAADIIAPLTVNIGGQLELEISVKSAGGVDDPVSLTARTTGESTGASVKLSTDDILTVNLVAGGNTTNVITIPLSSVGAGGLHIPLSTSNLGGTLTTLSGAASGVAGTIPSVGPVLSGVLSNPTVTGLLNQVGTTVSQVTNQVATVDLGYIDVDVNPHAIGGSQSSPPTIVGGTEAAGALDLLHVHVGVSASAGGSQLAVPSQLANIADLIAGHLEASSNLAAAIACNIPVLKTPSVGTVAPGGNFTYTIDVPNTNVAYLVDCDLTNMTVTDHITDYRGSPTFTVTGATGGDAGPATITKNAPDDYTVTWTGESYKYATPLNPPLVFTIDVSVPSGSPAGVIQDLATATATTANCQGQAAANAGVLTGSYAVQAPAVSAAGATATPTPSKLPFTGAMGGPWQPWAGLGLLCAGGAGLGLVRRARRASGPS